MEMNTPDYVEKGTVTGGVYKYLRPKYIEEFLVKVTNNPVTFQNSMFTSNDRETVVPNKNGVVASELMESVKLENIVIHSAIDSMKDDLINLVMADSSLNENEKVEKLKLVENMKLNIEVVSDYIKKRTKTTKLEENDFTNSTKILVEALKASKDSKNPYVTFVETINMNSSICDSPSCSEILSKFLKAVEESGARMRVKVKTPNMSSSYKRTWTCSGTAQEKRDCMLRNYTEDLKKLRAMASSNPNAGLQMQINKIQSKVLRLQKETSR